MFKVNYMSNRHCSGLFIVNFEDVWHIVQVLFTDFEHVNAGWNTLLL